MGAAIVLVIIAVIVASSVGAQRYRSRMRELDDETPQRPDVDKAVASTSWIRWGN